MVYSREKEGDCLKLSQIKHGMNLGLKEYSVLFKNTDWIVL